MSGRSGRRGFDNLGNVVFYGVPLPKIGKLIRADISKLDGQYPVNSTVILRLMILAGMPEFFGLKGLFRFWYFTNKKFMLRIRFPLMVVSEKVSRSKDLGVPEQEKIPKSKIPKSLTFHINYISTITITCSTMCGRWGCPSESHACCFPPLPCTSVTRRAESTEVLFPLCKWIPRPTRFVLIV